MNTSYKYTVAGCSAILLWSLIVGLIRNVTEQLGPIGGNMVLLATFSYFTPIFSTFFSAWILDIELTIQFWQGVIMVTLASLICWWFTREQR